MGNRTAIENLKKALEDKVADTFEEGTVIRWTFNPAASTRNTYTYAAIKTAVGWATTARFGPLQGIVSFEGLMRTLASAEVSDVDVSTAWEAIA